MTKISLKTGFSILSLGFSSVTLANTSGASGVGANTFNDFRDTMLYWSKGPYGTGVTLLMVLVGIGLGVLKNNPLPALAGICAAAFLNWGPEIILSLTAGALV